MNKINQIEKCTWRRPYFALNQGKGKLNGSKQQIYTYSWISSIKFIIQNLKTSLKV